MSQSPAVLKEPAVGWRLQKTSGRLTFSFLWKAFISSYWNTASLMINSEVKGRTSLCRLKRFPICDHRHVNVKVLKLSCINRNIFRLKCQLWLSFNIDEIKMSQFCDFNMSRNVTLNILILFVVSYPVKFVWGFETFSIYLITELKELQLHIEYFKGGLEYLYCTVFSWL